MSARIWVVIPTYNEAENVGPIVRAVAEQLDRVAPGEHRILIVDDSSPDGTGRTAEQLAEEMPAVEVMHRASKTGLGRAYIAGFEHALAAAPSWSSRWTLTSPTIRSTSLTLLAAAESADLVLGSRYVHGGAVQNWGIMRKAISRGGSFYARTVLGLKVRDLTGGFKCIHRSVLEAIDLRSIARGRLRVPDRGHLSRHPVGVHGAGGADRVRRPRRR